MGLGLAKPFARRLERDRRVGRERLEIGEPALGLRHALRDHDQKPPGQTPGERRHEHRRRRPRQPGDRAPLSRSGECAEDLVERRKAFDGVKEKWQRHGGGS